MANHGSGKGKNHNPAWNNDLFLGKKQRAPKPASMPDGVDPRASALPLKPPHLLAAAGEGGWKR